IPKTDIVLKGYSKTEGVYLVRCGDSDFYKIGLTTDIIKRIKAIQAYCPYPITLEKFWPTDESKTAETVLHWKYGKYNHRGEWFKLPKREVDRFGKYIPEVCR
ncbi:hypothetical protein LCGC14_2286850, partial [marine sediment metagenome]